MSGTCNIRAKSATIRGCSALLASTVGQVRIDMENSMSASSANAQFSSSRTSVEFPKSTSMTIFKEFTMFIRCYACKQEKEHTQLPELKGFYDAYLHFQCDCGYVRDVKKELHIEVNNDDPQLHTLGEYLRCQVPYPNPNPVPRLCQDDIGWGGQGD